MKYVKFTMYFEVAGYQEIPLPDDIDATDEDAVREYIASSWEHIKLPKEYDYVGDSGFDFDSPITIIDSEKDNGLMKYKCIDCGHRALTEKAYDEKLHCSRAVCNECGTEMLIWYNDNENEVTLIEQINTEA